MSTRRKTPSAAALAASSTVVEILGPERAPTRHDGWTTERQVAFLRALAATHSIAAAAREVGMTRQSAYRLRARLKGEPFDLAWDAAFHSAYDALAEAAMERALGGVEVPHYHRGELVGTSRRFDERLTIALLAMRPVYAPPQWHPASGYEPGDLNGLIERIERGPETWDGDQTDDDEEEEWDEEEDGETGETGE